MTHAKWDGLNPIIKWDMTLQVAPSDYIWTYPVPKLGCIKTLGHIFVKYWSNFVTWFHNVWRWHTQSRTAWIPLLSEIWLFKWPQVTIYMGTCPIPKLGCIKTPGHVLHRRLPNFVTWLHNVWIWYMQSGTVWIPLLSEIWLFKWPLVTIIWKPTLYRN